MREVQYDFRDMIMRIKLKILKRILDREKFFFFQELTFLKQSVVSFSQHLFGASSYTVG